MPVLNIYAQKDDIIPVSASESLKYYIASKKYDTLVFDGGHIGIYASKRAQKTISPKIATWVVK